MVYQRVDSARVCVALKKAVKRGVATRSSKGLEKASAKEADRPLASLSGDKTTVVRIR